MTVSKIYPFAYANARIRAMRARLLKKEDFNELLLKPYNEAIYTLEKKHYPQLSKYLGADFTYASVDKALRSSVIEDLSKVLAIAPEQSRKFLQTVLEQYDVGDIMTLIRTHNAKGELKTKDLVNITKIFSKEFVQRGNFTLESIHNELKGTPFQDVLEKHMDQIRRGEFTSFEIELKILYFRRLLHFAQSQEAKLYVKKLIDSRNIGLVLKGSKALIEGGRIPLEAYSGIKNPEQLTKLLNDHSYKITQKEPAKIEKEFHTLLLRYAENLLAKDPLSEASLIGFIALDKTIHRNVNILLKMKSHNFPKEKIQEVLAI